MNRGTSFVLANVATWIVLVSQPSASVLAPPADFKAFSQRADVIVVGTLTGTTERVWNEGGFPVTFTDHHFTINSEVKTDARMAVSETIILSTSHDPTGQEIAAALKSGQQYVLFLSWVDEFRAYSLIYGLAGAYNVKGDLAQPMLPNTELVQKHGRLWTKQLVALAKSASQ